MATRFRYKNPNSLSAFVELSPLYVATPDQLYEWLNACHLVERVEWQSSKASQGGGRWEAHAPAQQQGVPQAATRRLCHTTVPGVRGRAP